MSTPTAAGTKTGTARKPFRPDPEMPAYALPDPLATSGGSKIATADEWRTIGRPNVLELFRTHVYGRVPATPYDRSFQVVRHEADALDGAATLKQVHVTISRGPASLTIPVSLFVPNRAAKPVPAFLLIRLRGPEASDPIQDARSPSWPVEEAIARGYAMAAFSNGDVDPDRYDGFHDGIHGLLDVGARPPDAWGTIAAWAWGASRVMDYLETEPDLARDRIAVIGHSRGGKTALWAGAEDERFALVVSNDSGCTGAALSRRRFEGKELVARINQAFPHWFCENYKQYNNREDALPIDQHMLIALTAPRAVAVGSAEDDLWADPRGEFLSVVHAAPVYRLFKHQALGTRTMPNVGETIHGDDAHYHIREGKHGLTLTDWQSYMDFADRVFRRVG
jgi:(4-O-methyl)-D-glucuronate---lignin esterase